MQPDLRSYDAILVNSSGGKDSQAMLDYVHGLAAQAGVADRITVLHCDLGLLEWAGTAEVAAAQAAAYGARFEVRRREAGGELLDEVRRRGMWMSAWARYCTSREKRGPARKFITELVSELDLGRQARVLNCLGLRAEESTGRARKPLLQLDQPASSSRREVTTWLPIRDWPQQQVWAQIRASGAPYHWIYDHGLSRASCSLCVLASKADLLTAIRLRPDLAAEYAAVEWEIGDLFRPDISMLELIAQAHGVQPDRHRVRLLRLRAEYNQLTRKLTRLAKSTSPDVPARQKRVHDRRTAVAAQLADLSPAHLPAPDRDQPRSAA